MTNVNPENQPATPEPDRDTEGAEGTASGLPLRGLAMVLIAVAVLLAMWGLYATTQNNDSTDTTAQITTETPTAAPAPAPGESETAGEETPAEETTAGEATDEETAAEESRDGDRGTEARPAPRGGGAAAEPQRLHVLNNSLVPNLAADVAGTLDGEGYQLGEVGNLAEMILPENTVFFQPGNADAEKRARELADRVRGVAREYDESLPDGTEGRNDLTLVLVDQVAL